MAGHEEREANDYHSILREGYEILVAPHQHAAEDLRQLAMSNYIVLALTEGGEIYYWGRTILSSPSQRKRNNSPTKIHTLHRFVYISCSNCNSAAIDETGKLYVWGYNIDNYLNFGEPFMHDEFVFQPVQISQPIRFSSVAVGERHFIAISEFGTVFHWGENTKGQLGTEKSKILRPKHVSVPAKAKKVVCGNYHSVILLENGDLYFIGCTEPITQPTEEQVKLRKVDCGVWDVSCLNGRTVYVISQESPLPALPNTQRLVLQRCSWILLVNEKILVGVKKLHSDDNNLFQLFINNTQASQEIRAITFVDIYQVDNPNSRFEDFLNCLSDNSLMKGVSKLLKQPREQVVNSPNFASLLKFLCGQNEDVQMSYSRFLRWPSPIAKYLDLDGFFNWFMKLHASCNGDSLSTKIFLDYLLQLIQYQDALAEPIIQQVKTFFGRNSKVASYIPSLLTEIRETTSGDPKKQAQKATTFLAATLSSEEGRQYLVTQYTLNRFWDELCKHPQKFSLLKFLLDVWQPEVMEKAVYHPLKDNVKYFDCAGVRYAAKLFITESMEDFFKEILVTSLICHKNVIKSVAFIENYQARLCVIMPIYEEFDKIAEAQESQKFEYMLQIAEGVKEIQRWGIINKDIKPENILFDAVNSELKLIDFATCHLKSTPGDHITVSSNNGYTPKWAGSEFAKTTPYINFATDLILFGTLMANLILHGERPAFHAKKRVFDNNDRRLLGERLPPKVVPHFISFISACTKGNTKNKMTIVDVITKLKEILKMLKE